MIRLFRKAGGRAGQDCMLARIVDGVIVDVEPVATRQGRGPWTPGFGCFGHAARLAARVAHLAPWIGRRRWQIGERFLPPVAGCDDAGAMPARKPQPIHAVPVPEGFRVVRAGARYAVHRDGDERPGAWLADGEALPKSWGDTFTEDEARLLLPFLRVRGTAGRKGADPTTADGRLVARACERLGVTAAALAERIGAHEAVLSRARHGELPEKHREAIKALLNGGAGKAI